MKRMVCEYCTTWKLWLNTHKTETILFSKSRPAAPTLPDPVQIQDTFVSWASAVRYLVFKLDSEILSD